MKHYALIGKTLTHSYSKQLFDEQQFAEADYNLCPMPSVEGLRNWVHDNHIDGFNVTIPYKQTLIPQLDALSPETQAIGAVNCVRVDNGRLTGYNTDAPAFRDTLLSVWDPTPCATALILGTGGAARAVAYTLRQLNVGCTFVSRTPGQRPDTIGYSQINLQQSPSLIVNATPVGTWPDIDTSPWPQTERIPSDCLVYDLVYNPSPTLLMQQAAAAGAATHDGMAMLRRQAELSWEIWKLKEIKN